MRHKRKPGRRIDKTGRSAPDAKHIRIYRWMFLCPAYRALRSIERCILQELMFRFTGQNNGDIGLSIREATETVHCSKETAKNALERLVELGFIKIGQKGSFDLKSRHSTRWILTVEEYKGAPPTKDFMRWKSGGESKFRS